MSSGIKGDREETQCQLKNPRPIIDGKTWLRHRENSQAGLIDQMLLKGSHSVEDIAIELNARFKPEQKIDARMKRVRDHIEHLQDGDSRNRNTAMKPHKLRLKEVGGKWRFDL